MRDVSIIGIGRGTVGEHWGVGLRDLALDAVQAAYADCHDAITKEDIDALVVANAYGARLNLQSNTAPLLADYFGLRGVEAVRVEAADASGGLAVRQAAMMIQAGAAETVLVVGAEKVTDVVGIERNNALATSLDAEYEGASGATPVAVAGMLMRRYMYEHGVELASFENFSINAHTNGGKNPLAFYRNQLKPGRYANMPAVAPPINLFDAAPEGDGACALILTASERAADLVAKPVRIKASASASDSFALHSREDPLFLRAVNVAVGRAYQAAGITPPDLDVLELHDAYGVLSALQLEASGFAKRGEGWKLATEGQIMADGAIPICTFGGLKSRGHAIGATGVYQIAEAALQVRGDAQANQIKDAKLAMTLNLSGIGSLAVAHILGA